MYDKDYVSKVTKIKVAPVGLSDYRSRADTDVPQSRWDPDNLHRHPDYAPVKKEAAAQIKDEKLSEHEAMDSKTLPNHSKVDFEAGGLRHDTEVLFRCGRARGRVRK